MGPEALQTYINPEEVIRRLAGSMGIDQLGLVKGMDQVKSERQEQMQQQASMDQDLALTKQAAQLQQLPNDPSQTSPPTEEGGNQLPTQAGPEGGQPPAPGGVAGG